MANQNGYPVRIKDVGRVEDSFEEPRGLARLDGENAVSLIVQKQSGANTVEVVRDESAAAGGDPRVCFHRTSPPSS